MKGAVALRVVRRIALDVAALPHRQAARMMEKTSLQDLFDNGRVREGGRAAAALAAWRGVATWATAAAMVASPLFWWRFVGGLQRTLAVEAVEMGTTAAAALAALLTVAAWPLVPVMGALAYLAAARCAVLAAAPFLAFARYVRRLADECGADG